MQWHYDVLTVPPGADELARNARWAAGVRVGRTLAVQFHPEVDAAIVGRWAGDGGDAELARLGHRLPTNSSPALGGRRYAVSR